MTCTIHPDRPARQEAVGHLLCDECFSRYREERGLGGLKDRPFMQEILRRGYQLDEQIGQPQP